MACPPSKKSFSIKFKTRGLEGPIIRISPYELHVIDPAFFENLFRHDGRWDKYAWAFDAFSANDAIVCTADHDVHKARRQPLRAFFSKAKVTAQQDLIQRNLKKLCDRITEFKVSKTVVNLGTAIGAFARDVSTEYVIDRNYHSLNLEDFDASMTLVLQGSGRILRVTKHITWFVPTMKATPLDWIMKMEPKTQNPCW
jgi:hypothetical protein